MTEITFTQYSPYSSHSRSAKTCSVVYSAISIILFFFFPPLEVSIIYLIRWIRNAYRINQPHKRNCQSEVKAGNTVPKQKLQSVEVSTTIFTSWLHSVIDNWSFKESSKGLPRFMLCVPGNPNNQAKKGVANVITQSKLVSQLSGLNTRGKLIMIKQEQRPGM